MSERIAVYWDFENIHISLGNQLFGADWSKNNRFQKQSRLVDIPSIMQWINHLGRVSIHRAYANWSYLNCYSNDLQNHTVDLVQLFPRGSHAKNGADIRIAVDIMEDLRHRSITTVVIIGGDSDYIAVAQKIREAGGDVYGLGVEETTNPYWVRACHDFRFYHELMKEQEHQQHAWQALALRSNLSDEQEQRQAVEASYALNDAYERYVRILKDQQIRLVDPQLLSEAIQSSFDIFATHTELDSFDEFRQVLRQRMLSDARCTETDLAKIKAILYKARFFEINPQHPGVRRDAQLNQPRDALKRIQIMLIHRIVDNLHEPLHHGALQRLLPFGHLADIQQLLQDAHQHEHAWTTSISTV